MGGDKRGLLAIGVSILVFIVWYSFIVPHFWPQEEVQSQQEQVLVDEAKKIEALKEKEDALTEKDEISAAVPQKDIEEVKSVIETATIKATFSNYGGAPVAWQLKDYTVSAKDSDDQINLVPVDKLGAAPLSLAFDNANFEFPKTAKYELVESNEKLIHYRWASDKVTVEKIYSVDGDYNLSLKVLLKNRSKGTLIQNMSMGWVGEIKPEKKSGFFSFLKQQSDNQMPIYYLDGKVYREKTPAKLNAVEVKTGRLYWSGIEDRYFLTAIVPRGEAGQMGVELAKVDNGKGFYSGLVFPEQTLIAGGKAEYNVSVYGGPKEMHILKALGLGLDKAIDFGWFTFIAIPILYVLKFLYSVVHNYGIAIILLTILIKILLYPISKKSMKSMKGMKDLQPHLKEIKEKYGDDKQRIQMETMQLFKRHKVNPMSGCLPMILQFPVYIALYRVLWNSIELYHAPFFGFYTDLSQPDPYFITPVLLGVAMFLQQKMTPSASADPAQQKMMMMMPIMFTVFLAFLPVGLVVYILVNTLLTVLQQWMSNNDIGIRDLFTGKFMKKVRA